MALLLRLKLHDYLNITLEDGRVIKICLMVESRNRINTHITADKSIKIELIKAPKEEDDRIRNPC